MLYLIRYSEIGLKSKRVRNEMEALLIQDIKNAAKFYGIDITIKKIDGRIIIEGEKFIENFLKEIGGIKSFSPVILTGVDLNEIKEKVLDYSSFVKENESFALRVRKTGKHEYSSREVAVVVGDAVRIERNAKVDLDNPKHEIFIEIRERHAFIFNKIIEGIGGLPYGSQGKVLALIENENDLRAAWLMVRRGCHVDFAGNFEEEIKKMMKWRRHDIFNYKTIEEAEKIAIRNGNKAIVVGNENFVKLSIPVFYPLLASDYITFSK